MSLMGGGSPSDQIPGNVGTWILPGESGVSEGQEKNMMLGSPGRTPLTKFDTGFHACHYMENHQIAASMGGLFCLDQTTGSCILG